MESTTARLRLREFRASDLEDVRAYTADREVTRFLEFGPEDLAGTADWLRRTIAGPGPGVTVLAAEERSTGRLVGACDFKIHPHRPSEGELGYLVVRPAWGRGYATEIAAGLLELGFGPLGVHRCIAHVDPENPASIRVLEKVGMRREGLLREHKLLHGAWRNSILYAKLA